MRLCRRRERHDVATDGHNPGVLNKNQFAVLLSLAQDPGLSQRSIAESAGLSVGTVNTAVRQLVERGDLEREQSEGLHLTEQGAQALEPYRVDNAIILAAGLSTRFAPISYEKPKGLLRVRDEVLIERQIRQLKEAGIDDITVVVGYKKEYFFYLEELFDVRIVVNEHYAKRNNHSSLMAVLDKLGRTYVCSSDNYFVDNPFESHVYSAYYATQYAQDATDEWCVHLGARNRIVGVTIGGADSQIMLGHVFFDEPFSQRMAQIIRDEWDLPATTDKLWENLFIDHIDELYMVARPYPAEMIHEFDALDDLREFDPHFIENVDSLAFDNIVSALGCNKTDICDVYPLKQGLTNLSCHVRVATPSTCTGTPEWGPRTSSIEMPSSPAFTSPTSWVLITPSLPVTPRRGGRYRTSWPTAPSSTRMTPPRPSARCRWHAPCTSRARRSSGNSTSMPSPSATRSCCVRVRASSTFRALPRWRSACSACMSSSRPTRRIAACATTTSST